MICVTNRLISAQFCAVFIGLFLLPLLAAAGTVTRDWRIWPFSQNSPWNVPIGSQAQYAEVDYSRIKSYGITTDAWTSVVVQGYPFDPKVKVLTNTAYPATNWSYLERGGVQCGTTNPPGSPVNNYGLYRKNSWSTAPIISYHSASQNWRSSVFFPAGACPSPDTDGLMTVNQPDAWALDTYATLVLSSGDIDGDQITSFIDLKSDGTGYWNGRRASMIPSFAGLIRNGEIAGGRILHALAIVAPPTLLKPQAIWGSEVLCPTIPAKGRRNLLD